MFQNKPFEVNQKFICLFMYQFFTQDHAQDVSSKDEAHEQRKEEQNQKRKRKDKQSTAQRKKSKK